jgi:hypothetical protein
MVQSSRIRPIAAGLAVLAAMLAVVVPADAATKNKTKTANSKEAFFRCKDAKGQT